MRFYGKKIVRNYMRNVVDSRQETRDGILWDVLPDQRLCRVKIQGSNELIVSYYPENWEKTPSWLKPGNAVKIMHTQGIRGRIEVIGHGQLVPTPVADNQFPTIATPEDSILTGCGLIQTSTPRMVVLALVGTYRINGTVYSLGEIPMLYGANYTLSDGGEMGSIAGAVAINSAPSIGNYRYDLISVGIDGVIDYTPGTPSADPVEPSLDSGHLALGYIFVPCGTTAIYNGVNIGGKFSTPIPSNLEMTVVDDDLAWDELSTDITVEVYNQYGNTINGTGYGWYLTIEIISGNGKVSSPEEGESTTKIGGHTGTSSSYTFAYTRDDLDPGDISPWIRASVAIYSPFTVDHFITLRNVGGDIMI